MESPVSLKAMFAHGVPTNTHFKLEVIREKVMKNLFIPKQRC